MAADHGHRKCGIAAAVHKSLALHIAVQIDFLRNSVVGKKFLDLAAVRTAGKGINSHRFVKKRRSRERGPVLFQGWLPMVQLAPQSEPVWKRFKTRRTSWVFLPMLLSWITLKRIVWSGINNKQAAQLPGLLQKYSVVSRHGQRSCRLPGDNQCGQGRCGSKPDACIRCLC